MGRISGSVFDTLRETVGILKLVLRAIAAAVPTGGGDCKRIGMTRELF